MKALQISKQITIKTDESLNKYLNDIAKFSLISAEREVELAVMIKSGNQLALNELVNANLRFVVSVAKQYQHQGLSLSDLINEGNLGLLKAARRYDETRGFKFISYAVWWIRQGIIQSIAQNSRVVRLPLNKIGMISKIKQVVANFEQTHSRPPVAEEISRIIDVSIEEINLCLKNSKDSFSMDAPLNENNEGTLYEVLENKIDGPDNALLFKSLQIDLETAINSLTGREAEIIKLYYGIGDTSSMTLSEIGQELEITRERVRQIKTLALTKLKKTQNTRLLIKYL